MVAYSTKLSVQRDIANESSWPTIPLAGLINNRNSGCVDRLKSQALPGRLENYYLIIV